MPSLDVWANLLRVLDVEGVDRRQLPSLLRLSTRAVRSRVSAAVRSGWAEEPEHGGAQVLVGLSDQGAAVAGRWRELEPASECRWRAGVGAGHASDLRRALESVVSALPLELPHYPASYGAAAASITGGHGQDWKPVSRTGEDSVSQLPVSALVSQALVAFAIDYQELSPVALTLSAAVIKRIPPQGRPVRGLGHGAGLSALARHGFVKLVGDGKDAVVQLTKRGAAVHDAYDDRVEALETEWRQRFGSSEVAALRSALEAAVDSRYQSGTHTRRSSPPSYEEPAVWADSFMDGEWRPELE
ncbi:MAG: hypothetical protein ACRDXC_01700 [Acidimicrobiales bacterium]